VSLFFKSIDSLIVGVSYKEMFTFLCLMLSTCDFLFFGLLVRWLGL